MLAYHQGIPEWLVCIFITMTAWVAVLITPFTLLQRLLSHLNKIPGTVSEHGDSGSDSPTVWWFERTISYVGTLAVVPKLILGLLIGTMAVLDGLFSTLT